ncbi:hypothetical protein K432DRAFT_445208 [Lepidopterella palustris CBS 459.81]|uniref:Uncharacterized protein n=1 Tax=Lepidopterella palustris CBS 459.81 TaxID=1314670 RepID=A0A8E2E5M5_9PEZI|nr:hypothetical protein K432DRAFT_445208 [Lepidopterella palustris CBS 459.81]
MSSWLHKKRKGELIELGQQANLLNLDGLLKDDLISALETHFQQNESTLGKQAAFSEFYRRTGSPVKRERQSPTESGAMTVSKTRRRQTRLAEEAESQEEPTPEKALVTRTPRTISRITSQIDIPASPAQLANVAEQQLSAARSWAYDLWTKTYIEEAIEFLRETFSSVTGVEITVLLIEALGLQLKTLQWAHPFDTPPVASLSLISYPVYVPDVRVLLTSDFWAPATLWSLTSLFIPLLVSYFFNLTLRSNTRHRSSKGAYAADPLAFNIVKALMTYIVYPQTLTPQQGAIAVIHYPSWGPFSAETVTTVREHVPGGYAGLLIGAGIGILVSIYDAALKK